ncbi:hypothetical protein OIE69_44610 (plasmid) [Actinacidiphila glaucinigra]|uniref:hypothetical protein n=1 Tax=Actinacidiphila glaucinigra TaxID=235986 RepID=UPI002DDB7BD8|nr:hypothetical protein [Actinacidiphila glaucinigra]WSD65725.1 hypothetical protein OIE69_43240 [Actinacidiphila glaucinigra]WSD65987.1 hypothetical protein OIE69_44610 [Actinacidiphila glaucinigra]
MTDHAATAATVRAPADPALLALEFRHGDRLLDPAGTGLQTWQVSITADGELVGSLQATRGLWWKAGDLRERLTDEGSFVAEVAQQLLDPDGAFSESFEEMIEVPGNVLILDRCEMTPPWDDPLTVAGVAAAAVDRLTDNYFVVVFPRDGAPGSVGAQLLEQAGTLLAAVEFSDELLILDTSMAAPEQATRRVRDRLEDRARRGGVDLEDLDEEDWPEDEEHKVLTSRTAAVLRLAMEQLSQEAWQEVAALGDEVLPRGAGGLFGALPPVTLQQDGGWRRQMARTFDDLAADLADGDVVPLCTGEEMALHLGIRRAKNLHRTRPRLVAQAVEGLPAAARDFDWYACSDLLFEDHDVLMLFDDALDGIEDSGSDVNQALGMVNMAPLDWFSPFDEDHARDPERGFRHP